MEPTGDAASAGLPRTLVLSLGAGVLSLVLSVTPLVLLALMNSASGLKGVYCGAVVLVPALSLAGLILAIRVKRSQRDADDAASGRIGCLGTFAIALACLGLVAELLLVVAAIFFLPS